METDFVIVEANFGRTATDVCPTTNPLDTRDTDTYCVEEDTISILYSVCDADEGGLLTQCQLSPSTDDFGDSCAADIKKYLEVTIDCQFTGINLPFIII